MIDLTPLEVRQKKNDLPRGLRGYDPGHVDDFLDLVADRLEALVKENRRLAEELETLRASTGEYRDREKALTEALVSAQQMRESVREQSTREAELMRREAEHEAQRVRDDALRAIGREEETLRRLRARQRQLVEGYRGMLERELRELAVVADSLEAGEPVSVPAVAPATAGAPAEAGKAGGGKGREPDGRAAATGADAAATGAGAAAAGSKAPATGSTAAATGATAERSRSEREPASRPSVGSAGQAGPPEAGARAAREGDATPGAGGATPAAGDAAPAADAATPAAGDTTRAAGDDSPAEDAGEEGAERRTPWTVPPPASPRPAGDRRGHGRDRFAPPAASLGRTDPRPGRSDEAAGDEAAKPGRSGDDEPDWLAAILKEE